MSQGCQASISMYDSYIFISDHLLPVNVCEQHRRSVHNNIGRQYTPHRNAQASWNPFVLYVCKFCDFTSFVKNFLIHLLVCLFWDWRSLCSFGWPEAYCVEPAGLELVSALSNTSDRCCSDRFVTTPCLEWHAHSWLLIIIVLLAGRMDRASSRAQVGFEFTALLP